MPVDTDQIARRWPFMRFYVPIVCTLTLLVELIDAVTR